MGTRRVSVIVPVYEQWHLIPDLLRSFELQDTDGMAVELLLVDNGSTRLQSPDKLPANCRILTCKEAGSYAARNFGVQASTGEILVFTDADCVPRDGWLAALVGALDDTENRIVAGGIEMNAGTRQPNIYQKYDLIRGIPQEWYVYRGYAATANIATSRTLFDRIDGFDAKRKSGGDADFCRRATARGAQLQFVRDAVVEHPARSTWHEVSTKARRIKGGQIRHQRSRKKLAVVIFRTLMPPVIAYFRFARAKRWPLHYRLTAILIQTGLWSVEVVELLRLIAGGIEERR